MDNDLARCLIRAAEQAPLPFDWGQLTWLDSADLSGHETLTIGLCEIDPGEANPVHYHPNADEAFYLLEGRVTHTLGDETFELGPGDLLHCPRNVPHQAINSGTVRCKAVVVFNNGRRETINV